MSLYGDDWNMIHKINKKMPQDELPSDVYMEMLTTPLVVKLFAAQDICHPGLIDDEDDD